MPQQIKMSVIIQSKVPVNKLPNPYKQKFLSNPTQLNGPMISRVGGVGQSGGCGSCGRKG